ncbi:MAG: hypothetical protein ACI8VC_000293 [Candidatus Endobugula sp.]|jgi:hypothetical protein
MPTSTPTQTSQKAMTKALLSAHQETITTYMYLGLLPFFAGAFGPWIFADNETVLTDIFLHYSTIIYSFLAGSIWAIALFAHNSSNTEFIPRHIHAAILFSLLPFVGYFLPNFHHTSLAMVSFFILLFWEKLFLQDLYPNWYQALRHRITFIAVACHMLVLWNLMKA